jgi:single-stranded DNA-binding protein
MNHCIFSGYLLFDPSVGYEPKPSVCTFKLVTYEYVRNKRGEKKRYPTTITFQAFDSGADAIAKL